MVEEYRIEEIPSGQVVVDRADEAIGVSLGFDEAGVAWANKVDHYGERVVKEHSKEFAVANRVDIEVRETGNTILSQNMKAGKLYYSKSTNELVRILGEEHYIGPESWLVEEDKKVIFLSKFHGCRLEVLPGDGYEMEVVEIQDMSVTYKAPWEDFSTPTVKVEVVENRKDDFDSFTDFTLLERDDTGDLGVKIPVSTTNLQDAWEEGYLTLIDGTDSGNEIITSPVFYVDFRQVSEVTAEITFEEEIDGIEELATGEYMYVPFADALVVKTNSTEHYFEERSNTTGLVLSEDLNDTPDLFSEHPEYDSYKVSVDFVNVRYGTGEPQFTFDFKNTEEDAQVNNLGNVPTGTKIKLLNWGNQGTEMIGKLVNPSQVGLPVDDDEVAFKVYHDPEGLYDEGDVLIPLASRREEEDYKIL